MKRLIKYLLRLIFVKKVEAPLKELSLLERYEFAHDSFQHFAIRSIYGNSHNMGRTVSQNEIDFCHEMADRYKGLIEELRTKIVEQETQKIHEQIQKEWMVDPSQ